MTRPFLFCMKKAILPGSVLAALTVLQLVFGNIESRCFAFPANAILSVVLLGLGGICARIFEDSTLGRGLRKPRTAAILCAICAVGCLVGGMIPQTGFHGSGPASGITGNLGLTDFFSSIFMISLLVAVIFQLTYICFLRFKHGKARNSVIFLLIHGGLCLALWSGMAGSPDTRIYRVQVSRFEKTDYAYNSQGESFPLPFAMQLKDFRVLRNPSDNSPVQYKAGLDIDGKAVELLVNHPYAFDICTDIYLTDYEQQSLGSNPRYCTVQIVKQPWKWLQLSGILLLALGCVGFSLRK